MRLKHSLLKLPIAFDAARLAEEVRALPASAWIAHPGGYPGNDAVPLVTPGGAISNAFTGQMAATVHLDSCAYVREVMAAIGAVWGRSRLMGLGGGARVPAHVDVNYHWRTHIRIHIPVITNPAVRFNVGPDSVHMAPGECWVFDSFRMHDVHNGGADKRVHLVLDTPGGEELWDLIEQAEAPTASMHEPAVTRPHGNPVSLRFEHVPDQAIMTAWEVSCHIDYLRENIDAGPRVDAAFRRLDRFLAGWTALFGEAADPAQRTDAFRRLIAGLQQDLARQGLSGLQLRNQVPLARALAELIFQPALPAPGAAAPGVLTAPAPP